MLILGGLKRNARNGTGHGTKVAGDAPLGAFRVTGKNDPSSPPGRDGRHYLRIEDRLPLAEGMQKDEPDTS
jgi:hypothetical protein